jgi:hypothetical protein
LSLPYLITSFRQSQWGQVSFFRDATPEASSHLFLVLIFIHSYTNTELYEKGVAVVLMGVGGIAMPFI